jgi:50S ribosomal subunit-associated GTPase HflX
VVDATDPKWLEKIETVNGILSKLNLEGKPQIVAFNKVDCLVSSPEEFHLLDHSMVLKETPSVYVSAVKKWNINRLLDTIRALAVGEREYGSV